MKQGEVKSLIRVAKADANAVAQLGNELKAEFDEVFGQELDTEMVLPLCKEIQAKAQAVANRVETLLLIEGYEQVDSEEVL